MTRDITEQLTLQEAADDLGVHYMTAYRYVRLGLLPATKQGSTWRVARESLAEFRAASRPPPPVDGDDGRPGRRRAPWAERLEARLLAGDARGAWGVIEAALAAGADLEEVYLHVIAPALTSIGERWERGEVDVGVEHRASGIVTRLLGRLAPRFTRRGRTRGSVVIGAPAGDQHALPGALVSDLLRGAGFEVSDLGADVPASSLARTAADAQRLVAVAVSATTPGLDEAVATSVQAVRAVIGPQVAVLVGGAAIADLDHALALGADGWAADARGAVELVEAAASGRP